MIRRFGDFLLDEECFDLTRAGQRVELEPRAFELLAYLARHSRRVVTKEELVREVWQGKFVSDAAVTYSVGAVRRAIAGDPAVTLATVHGRGYRLDAEVELVALATPDLAVSHPERPDNPPALEAARLPPLASESNRTRGRRRRIGIAVGLGTALLVLGAVAYRAARRDGAASSAATREAILVIAAPQVADGDAELQLLAVSLVDAVRARLEQVPGLALRPDDPALPGVAGAPALVLTLERDKRLDRARLRALLSDPAGGPHAPIGRFDVPILSKAADLAAFNQAREAIATFVVDFLLPAVDLAPGEEGLTPHDAEAYRLYLLANDISEEVSCDDERFAELLQASLARDERFAPAWEVLGWAQYGQVAYCAGPATGYADALTSAERALALAPGWPAALMLKISVLAETGRWSEAWRVIEDAPENEAYAAAWMFGRSLLLNYVGEVDRAVEELERCVEKNPVLLSFTSWTPNALLYAGETGRFLELVPAAVSPIMRYYHAEALVRAGRTSEASATLEAAFASNPGDLFARLCESYRLHLAGDRAGALAVLQALERDRLRSGGSDGEVTFKMASLAARTGAVDLALEALTRAVDQGFACAPCFRTDPAFAALADDRRFAEILERAGERARREKGAAGFVPLSNP
ncbi:MAG: winged helix-turn-helix domain-containing protein [Thermoanaerobaculia bacterium]|nr:winged helix-turn-helix domain-containing protein [Thermoanaerobaculia bacterium]